MRARFEYGIALVAAFLLGGAIAFAVEMRKRARVRKALREWRKEKKKGQKHEQ